MKNKYFALKLITNQIIFIDGMNRTGKLLTGSLVASLKKMEHLEFGEIFQHIIPAIKLKKCSIDFSKALLSNYINQLVYNKFLSRNVNFRTSDRTGVPNFRKPKVYFDRLKFKEGDTIIKKIKREKPYLPFVTHDIACNYNEFLKLGIDAKIIEIFRNPIDLAYSWYNRRLSTRFGKDPRIFTLLVEKNKKPYSQHLYNLPKTWGKLNDLEKCIMYVKILNDRSVEQIKKNYKKNNIYITNYEEIVSNTKDELKNIARFLNSSFSSKTLKFIKKENCPNEINIKARNKKLELFRKNTKKKIFQKLELMANDYEKNFYGLKKFSRKK